MANLLLLDNIDSFTYNLVDQLRISLLKFIIYRHYVATSRIIDALSKKNNPFPVARYHSLICKRVPEKFIVNASFNKIIMAIRNDCERICGFQFHPESILTPQGTKLLNQTLNWAIK
ncbi:glutamine amidotransferase-related protein [Buchnera aphidicola]|uniref:glutamine amidotransferase-related protein n=1 Tax=Buchnera aphidicola TaxID=9 RepID=UPI003464CE21